MGADMLDVTNLLLAAVLVACGAKVADDTAVNAVGQVVLRLDMAAFDAQRAALRMHDLPDELMAVVCGGQAHVDWRFANETFLGRVDAICRDLKARIKGRKAAAGRGR